ncbi:MAG: glycosyltransferase family 2 protein [Armatimonadota bacterium]
MRLLSEAVRAAGNVLLAPVTLAQLEGADRWRRVRLVGSRNQAAISQAVQEMRELAPSIAIGAPGERHDVICLLLTGEGLRGEKLAALLSRSSPIIARGAGGRWYRLRLPAVRPASIRWWLRSALAGLLSLAYQAVLAGLAAADLLRRLAPPPPPKARPGVPTGRTVTFIVPTYNQRALMDFCLPPLLAEAGDDHRVLVVDDASADDTVPYLRAHYPQVSVVALARNHGFGGAVSAGIAASQTPLFALINTDVQVRPGFLAAILPHFERADTFAVCSRIDLPGGSQMETGNVAAAWSGVLEPYHVPPVCAGPVLYAGGASSVYDRVKYEALGGFETIYRPMYFEDIELGWRAWRRGWKSLFEPAASVLHQRRAWIGTRFSEAQANERFLRNGLLFVWKNVRDPVMLAQNCAYVCARLFVELADGEGTMARALLGALPHFGRMLASRWRDRRRGDLSDRQILELSRPCAVEEPAR